VYLTLDTFGGQLARGQVETPEIESDQKGSGVEGRLYQNGDQSGLHRLPATFATSGGRCRRGGIRQNSAAAAMEKTVLVEPELCEKRRCRTTSPPYRTQCPNNPRTNERLKKVTYGRDGAAWQQASVVLDLEVAHTVNCALTHDPGSCTYLTERRNAK